MKLFLILPLIFFLSSCGFRPLYGTHDTETGPGRSTRALLASIAIADIPDQSGVALKNNLIDRFYTGPAPSSPAYTLAVAPLVESMTDLDITVDDEATRRQLRLETTYTLTRTGSPEAALIRTAHTVVSFNVLESRFTTRVAENNARENAIADLARQVEQTLLLHLSNFYAAPRP